MDELEVSVGRVEVGDGARGEEGRSGVEGGGQLEIMMEEGGGKEEDTPLLLNSIARGDGFSDVGVQQGC